VSLPENGAFWRYPDLRQARRLFFLTHYYFTTSGMKIAGTQASNDSLQFYKVGMKV
jgi:hypothetical protein